MKKSFYLTFIALVLLAIFCAVCLWLNPAEEMGNGQAGYDGYEAQSLQTAVQREDAEWGFPLSCFTYQNKL